MKTIEQRLQSRISKRRNFIRTIEQDVAMLKSRRKAIRDLDLGFDSVVYSLSNDIFGGKVLIRQLADDQRLDKRLKVLVGEIESNRRFYDLPPMVV